MTLWKRILLYLGVLAILSSTEIWAAAKAIGHVSFIVGGPKEVLVKHKTDTSWEPVRMKSPVYNADLIQTKAESRCEVKLLDGGIIRIGENTYFEFTASSIVKGRGNTRAVLTRGKIWTNLSKRKKKGDFQIKAPTAVCAVRGTIYRIDADTATTCRVYDGVVDVGPVSLWGQPGPLKESKSLKPMQVPGPHEVPPPYEVTLEQWVKIVRGYQITVRPDGKYAKSKFDAAQDAQLEWVRWNQTRDGKLK